MENPKKLTKINAFTKMSKWSGNVSTTFKETGIGPGCIYNANQTGLFYTKLLNCLYILIDNRRD